MVSLVVFTRMRAKTIENISKYKCSNTKEEKEKKIEIFSPLSIVAEEEGERGSGGGLLIRTM